MKRVVLVWIFIALATPLFSQEAPEKKLVEEVSREFQGHNYKKVIQLYRDFAANKPHRYLPLVVKVLYSQSLADTGEIEEAIASLKEVLTEMPTEADSLQLEYDLANLLFMEKRYDEAAAAYRKVFVRANQASGMLSKAKERLSLIKDRTASAGSRRKDATEIEMMDLGTLMDLGEVPEGTEIFLQRVIDQNPKSPQSEEAKRLQARVKEIRTQKAKALLDEARRLFDEEKKYTEVREVLEQIQNSYADVSEMPSVIALLKAVQTKLGR